MKLKTGLELLVLIITLCSALSLKTSKSLQSSLTLKEDTLANKNKDTNTKVKRMEEYLKVLLEKPYKMNTEDQVSFSNNLEVTQKHLVFDVDIDMDNHSIKCKTRLFYHCKKTTSAIILDSMNLNIEKVTSSNNEPLQFSLFQPTNISQTIGKGLAIMLEDGCKTDSYLDILYSINTRPLGLHFSDPIVIHDKKFGFLATHGEAIYSRSYFPSQDSPSLKVTSEAIIRIKNPYSVLFSGILQSVKEINNKEKLEYRFKMDIPIPTYLITFAAGSFKKIQIKDSRCSIYYEKGNTALESKIYKTFEKCENYIKYYEKTYNLPFQFGQMVFLITPKDYPYRGMENPYVTYIAESVLTQDHSYDQTLAHEIAHFWSGDLVTNRNWEHFWLNEGFTTYSTRKAVKAVNGDEMFFFELFKGLISLKHAMKDLSSNSKLDKSLLSLSPQIIHDPYATFSRVPYEKGSLFLYHIEKVVGEQKLNNILGNYFNKFKFTSVTAKDFREHLEKDLDQETIKKINWVEWTTLTGDLPQKFDIKSKRVDNFQSLLTKVSKEGLPLNEMENMFKELKIVEKDVLFDKLSEKHDKKGLSSSTINNLTQILKDESIVGSHITNKVNSVLLLAKFEKNETERENLLISSIDGNQYYGASHLKKIFKLLKEIKKYKSNLGNLVNVLDSFKMKLNPLTYERLLEKINEK